MTDSKNAHFTGCHVAIPSPAKVCIPKYHSLFVRPTLLLIHAYNDATIPTHIDLCGALRKPRIRALPAFSSIGVDGFLFVWLCRHVACLDYGGALFIQVSRPQSTRGGTLQAPHCPLPRPVPGM